MEAGGGVRRGEREEVDEVEDEVEMEEVEEEKSRIEGEVWIRAMAEREAPTNWPIMRAGKVESFA